MDSYLTIEDLQQLSRPFLPEQYEFHRGFCYVSEEAVCERIEEIDQSWQFGVKEVKRTGKNDQFAVVTAVLTIKQVSRSSTGMQAVEYRNNKDGSKSEIEAGEPEKGALTDALKRCARLFGIGRDLLTLPPDVKDTASLATWQKKRYPASPVWWIEITRSYSQHPAFAGDKEALSVALRDLLSRGILQMTSPTVQVKAILDASYSGRR